MRYFQPSDPPEAGAPFLFAPAVVVREHLEGVANPPSAGALQAAGETVRSSYQEFGGTKDALGVCIELNQRLSESTTVLAALFAANSDSLPARWRANPEITRTVLSICGFIELGFLRAQQVATAHEGGSHYIDDRIPAVEGLMTILRAK